MKVASAVAKAEAKKEKAVQETKRLETRLEDYEKLGVGDKASRRAQEELFISKTQVRN